MDAAIEKALRTGATVLTHVEVEDGARSIWTAALAFVRPRDINNMASLRTVRAHELENTLGGYTEPDLDTVSAHVTMNSLVTGLPSIIQASIVMHEGRHVRQIAKGSLRASVRDESEALTFERDFLRPHVERDAAARRRVEDIAEQLGQLARQEAHLPPRLVMKASDDAFVCGCIKELRPGPWTLEVWTAVPAGDGLRDVRVGSVVIPTSGPPVHDSPAELGLVFLAKVLARPGIEGDALRRSLLADHPWGGVGPVRIRDLGE